MPEPEPLPSRLLLHRWRLLAAAGGVLALWVLAAEVAPRYAGTFEQWQTWRAQRARLASVTAWEVEQTNIEARRLFLQQRFASLYVSLPKSDQMSAVLQALQQYAATLAVQLKQVRQGDRTVHAAYDELPVEVELLGTFHGIGGFVDQVERSPYLMKVHALDVTAQPEPFSVLNARVQLRVIILREKP